MEQIALLIDHQTTQKQESFIPHFQMTFQQKQQFLSEFFNFNNPQPLTTSFTQQQFRSNDMKISLQIATKSYLRMQSQPKTGAVSFSCKNYGKSCYEILGYRKNNLYFIQTDYTKMRHAKCCELSCQIFEYLKIYNLMKLKKDLIENHMTKNQLMNASPAEILSSISEPNEYFFQKDINYNSELRRKLRKRFDNIINIDIKKITKGGRQYLECVQQNPRQVLKQVKNIKRQNKNQQKQDLFDSQDQIKNFKEKQKQKLIKKNSKGKKKEPERQKSKQNQLNLFRNQEKQNDFSTFYHQQHANTPFQYSSNQYFSNIDDPIYMPSESELPQIKELNEGCHFFGDIFSWSEEEKGVVQMETINDKLRQTILLGMKKNIKN